MAKVAALGLDVGRRRIGLAGCDGLGLIATGLTTIHRVSYDEDITNIQQWVHKRGAEILVIGLPYCLNGALGRQAKETQKFARRLGAALDLPIEYVDERLTSVEAEAQLKAQKKYCRRNKGLVDRQAAVIILQQWLDQRRSALRSCI